MSTTWMSKPDAANCVVVAPRKQPTSIMVLALMLAAIARISWAISGSLDHIAGRLVGGSAGRYPSGVKLSGSFSGVSMAVFFLAIIWGLLVTIFGKPFYVYAVLLEKFYKNGGMLTHVVVVNHVGVHCRATWGVIHANKY